MDMELPRRFSGGRMSLKDDLDIDFNDASRASTPMSILSSKSEGRRRERSSHHHTTDDYKRKIARLKSELEMEKARNKQVYRDKSEEIKLIRESYAQDRNREYRELEKKLSLEKQKEVEILQENIIKRKDEELQQVFRYKEDEVKNLNEKLKKEKETKMVTEEKKREYKEELRKMKEELQGLKEEKEKIEKEYSKKCDDENKKEKEFSELKEGYDAELRRIIGESKKLAMGNLQKLKKAEKALVNDGSALNEDDDLSLLDRMTPFSDYSSRAPSTSLGFRLEDLKLDDLRIEEEDIENLLASAQPAPSAFTKVRRQTPVSLPSKSPNLVSPRPFSVASDAGDLDSTLEVTKRVQIKANPRNTKKNRRLSEDKDKQLQRKVSELQTQTQRLERKIALLKTENDLLKKKQDDQRPLEEKIKALKKRNAELAAIARRLEEKAKHLQQENMKKIRDETGQHDSEYLKKMFARQRAKDLAEHAKAMLSKDREIEDLRKKCQELADALSNTDFLGPENSQMYEEKEELVSIIKQAAKERLQLEKQLAKSKPTPGTQTEAKKLKELEVTNEALEKEIARLEKAKSETERLEIELAQKKIECETLTEEIRLERVKSRFIYTVVQETASQNTQLTIQVSDLQQRLQQLEKVNEECNVLRLNLTEAQHECDIARNERNTLQTKVHDLESVVKTLQESADKLTNLENDYQTTKQKLHEKQSEILTLQKDQDIKSKDHEEVVTSLQNKIEELKESCHKQEQQHLELTQELKTLQAATNQHHLVDNWAHISHPGGDNSGKKHNNNPHNSSAIRSPVHENFHPTNINSQESLPGKLVNGSDNTQVDSTKSLDTGFADDDTVELENSNEPSPDQAQPPPGPYEDPELYEIAKKLTELEAADSEEENLPTEEKGDDSGMESNREMRVKPVENGHSGEDSRRSGLGMKGPLQVYIAKYTYDPFQHSPNENPDAELPINTGDYLLVYGDMDEDAFYDGELIDGRRGLVPSNFIEKVKDEDLADFHAAVAGFAHHEDDSNAPSSILQDLDFDSSEETDEKPLPAKTAVQDHKNTITPLSHTHNDLDEIESEIANRSMPSVAKIQSPDAKPGIPCPHKLTLDRQLTSSILISWRPPTEEVLVKSYHIYVDGDFKASVKSNERTKALVENVDSRNVHRVSVRCLTNIGQSCDQQCTILLGKDAVPIPSQLSVSDITPNSATISWLPGNSNYQHTLSINGREARVVKPGVFTYIITGLVSDTDHNVVVSAQSLTGENKGDNLSASIDFRTPAGGLPEPPINIQVEAGPQEGTLLLTWFPVTIDTSGSSNGAMVTGYVVYADGRRTKEALGPTNDHIILSAKDFLGFIPKQLLVRTVTRDGQESAESQLVRLPQTLIKEITAGAAKSIATEALVKVTDGQRSHVERALDTDPSLMYRELPQEEASAVTLTLNAAQTGRHVDDYSDTSSSSELSDIPEVEEEDTASHASVHIHRSPSLDDCLRSPAKANDTTELVPAPSGGSPTNKQEETTVPIVVHAPQRIVPAIEITRDSSSERGNSVSEDEATSPTKFNRNSVKSDSPTRSLPSRNSPSHSNKDRLPGYQENSDGRDDVREKGKVKQQVELFNKLQNNQTQESSHGPVSLTGVKVENDLQDNSIKLNLDNRTSPQDVLHSPVTLVNGKAFSDQDSNANELLSNDLSPSGRRHPEVPSLDLNEISVDESAEVDSISGEINPPVDDTRIRLFVALFDYDPISMSPNVDCIDEELPFKEGQIIKIYGDKDQDGFYRGECNNRIGFVPCNMVSEIQVDDADLAEQLLKESQEAFSMHSHLTVGPESQHYNKSVESLETLEQNGVPIPLSPTVASRRMVALYDYDPQELSPNVDSEVELPFRIGDILYIYGDMDDDGFYMAELNGHRGLVPSNFLQDAPLQEEDPHEATSIVSPARSGESLNHITGSHQSDLGLDKTSNMGPSPTVESVQPDWVESATHNHTPTRSRSATPDEIRQKKKSTGGILSKGKNIFKKLTR
ncbi:peripheral-type benzodiazepine receptor-associated protein 1-like [Ylistrum balloti]|uniref:peripheral-type benzodiazepine receptor-associated protein 1-like n=1 Tax=Ylistrum balloti TaxID=509963 RepID=UPI002905BC52|nr:peripheral-type benzodiazepine receptor-associated protein 1-like [Ylistrum balloti]